MLTGYLVSVTMSLQSVRLSSAGLVFLLSFVAYFAAISNAAIHNYTFIVSFAIFKFYFGIHNFQVLFLGTSILFGIGIFIGFYL